MNITCSNEMDTIPCLVSAYANFRDFCTKYDVFDTIKREESRKAQARKNARKQRARELTKARELEIKKAKGCAE